MGLTEGDVLYLVVEISSNKSHATTKTNKGVTDNLHKAVTVCGKLNNLVSGYDKPFLKYEVEEVIIL